MGKMGCKLFLSFNLFIKKIKEAAHKNDDIDGMCKRIFTICNLPFGLGKLHSSTKYSSLNAVSNICPKMKEHERQNACNVKR